MTKRIINKKLLREWLVVNGKNSVTELAFKAGCSTSLVQKICSDGYEKIPSLNIIDGICSVTGYPIDTLFPVCEATKESA